MPRRPLRRGLLASLIALVALPILVAMTLGTAALLAAVGDTLAAAVCRWVALALGICWGCSVVTTTACAGFMALDDRLPRRRRGRRRRHEAGFAAPRADRLE